MDKDSTNWIIHYVNPVEIAILVKMIHAFTRLKGKIEKSTHFILSNLVTNYVTKKIKVKEMENLDRKRAKESANKINRQIFITAYSFNGKLLK